jgi:hypothetical protein
MSQIDEKMTAWTERVVSSVKEAFPAPTTPPPPNDPPKNDPPKATDPPKNDPPKNDPPVPGKKTFAQWWFGS